MDIQVIRKSIMSCKRCLLREQRRGAPHGGDHPTFLFLGQSLHGDENDTPFLCKSGGVLDKAFEALGWPTVATANTKSVYALYNIVACHTPNNTPPTDPEIAMCRLHLLFAIKELNPKFIISLGGFSTEQVALLAGCQRPARDEVVKLCDGHFFASLPHPAFALRGGEEAIGGWVKLVSAFLHRLEKWRNKDAAKDNRS